MTAGRPPHAAEAAARARTGMLVERARAPGLVGPWTLFAKEVRRFWSSAGQSVVSPVLSTVLYLLVFGHAIGARVPPVDGVPYADFLAPGLVMLGLINNAFINSAFSLFLARIQGTVVDILVTPLSPLEILVAYNAASVLRAMLVGALVWAVAALLGAHTLAHVGTTLAFMLLASLLFSLVGMVAAIHARDFNHLNLLPSFVITPLVFLGGVFWSVTMLPEPWRQVSLANPVLYMVNGLRYGMVGRSDVPVLAGAAWLVVAIAVVGGYAWRLLRTGRKLRE